MKKVNNGLHCMTCILFILLLFTRVMPAQGQDICEKLKNRTGNDDIVIMVDTSLSMIHLIDDIRKQLKDFFQCYIKKGDFIILGTFDSHCHIQFSMKVLKPETDLKLLNLQV